MVAVSGSTPWLTVTNAQGDACNTSVPLCSTDSVVAIVNPTGLAPGVYNASVAISADDGTLPPATVPIALEVDSLSLSATSLNFKYSQPGATAAAPLPQTVTVTSTSGPVAFSVSTEIQSNGNWLSVKSSSTTTPATLTVTANPAGLATGKYTATILVTDVPASQTFPICVELDQDTGTFTFTATVGSKATDPQYLFLNSYFCPSPAPPCSVNTTATVSTSSGGNWLSAIVQSGTFAEVRIAADPTGLGTGTYLGAVMVAIPNTIAVFPVVLKVTPPIATPPPTRTLVVQPPSLNLTSLSNYQTLQVTLGSAPADFTATLSGDPGLNLSITGQKTGELDIQVFAGGSGVYHGMITITAAGQSVAVPITMTNPAIFAPILGTVASAAAQTAEPISPGEILALHGSELGPGVPDPAQVRVFFDDTPGKVLYAAQWQVDVIAPATIAGKQTVQVRIEYANLRSESWSVPVSPSAPGIFTLNGSGVGQAAVLNQDNSVNGVQPATAGSVIQIFATGAGNSPTGPVKVSIAGVDAAVLFAGQAPAGVNGLFQINAVVPAGIAPGNGVPLVLTIGGTASQSGSTIAVK